MAEKKQSDEVEETPEAATAAERPTSARSTAEAADVVMDTYAKLARPGR